MRYKVTKKNIISCLGVFLITIGNGKFLSNHFGEKIEYLGLFLVLLAIVFFNINHRVGFRVIIRAITLIVLLSAGAFVLNSDRETRITLLLISVIIVFCAALPNEIFADNQRLKLIADSICIGCIFTFVIGIFTGTLGLYLHQDNSILGFTYAAGFTIKNYTGGLWLLLFVLYYIYFLNVGKLKKKLNFLLLVTLFIFIVLSGSRGASFLCVVFWVSINQKKLFLFAKEQKKLVGFLVGIVVIVAGIYIYTNVLANISSYAYRMRGLSSVMEYLFSDIKRFMFGLSDIAYANTGYNYTDNMRNFLGWNASVEMAYVNILIKSGFLGLVAYLMIYIGYVKKIQSLNGEAKNILLSLFVVMVVSGLVETYISSIHYIVGPVLYCTINGMYGKQLIKKGIK